MIITLWMLAVVAAVGLAYTRQFTATTLSFGRELSETDSGTGFQDAITPPWQTNFALMVYVGSIGTVVLMWWASGWVSAIGALVLIVAASSLATVFLPKPGDNHYRNLILQSMCSRYADYVRDGDEMRAQAMSRLLTKSGMDPETLKGS